MVLVATLDLDGRGGGGGVVSEGELGFFHPRVGMGMDGQDLNENEIVFRWELSLARFCPPTRSVWRHYALQIVYITRSACLCPVRYG
jgi:hypothetical protein